MTERVTAWQCISCGRVEGPQPCVGVCQDRKVEFVYAADHDAALLQLSRARAQVQALTALLHQLVHTMPRDGGWETTYRALQSRAKQVLVALGADVKPGAG
jgi:hypothetical protein